MTLSSKKNLGKLFRHEFGLNMLKRLRNYVK